MPNETSIPIGIDKENIVTVPKEKMKSMKQFRTFVPKKGMTPIETKKAKQIMAPIYIQLRLTL